MRSGLMFAACVAALLSGCLGEAEPEVRTADQVARPSASRAVYLGQSLANFAIMNAQGRAEPGVLKLNSGAVKSAAMLCPLFNGTRSRLFAWLIDAENQKPEDIAVNARLARVGKVAQWNRGRLLTAEGTEIEIPRDCEISGRSEGAPVVVIDVALDNAKHEPFSREETQTRSCPDGYSGYAVYVRTIDHTAQGTTVAHAWRLSDMGKCLATPAVAEELTQVALPAWSSDGETEIDNALDKAAPDRCTRARVSATGPEKTTQKVFDTCTANGLADRLPLPEPIPYPPEPATDITRCDEAVVTLPALSTVAAYTEALAPYKTLLTKLHRQGAVSSTCITIRSTALWPTWATFYTHNMNGVSGTSRLTRLYTAKVWFEFVGNAATNTWAERHVTPYGYNYNYRSLPAQFYGTDPEHWISAEFYATSVTVRTMDGRGYTQYAGPRSQYGAYRRHNLPIPYANKTGEPWGHTPEQAAAAHAISFAAFGRQRYNYEFATGYPE